MNKEKHTVDINTIIEDILHSEWNSVEKILKTMYDDCNFFDNVVGILKEENARSLIIYSLKKEEYLWLLTNALYYSDIHTVSEEVFSMLCSFPRKRVRESLLTTIAHCKISFYQLQAICEMKICIEAFASVLEMYVKYDCFSPMDLKKLIRENTDYLNTIDIKQILTNTIISEEKRSYIESLL